MSTKIQCDRCKRLFMDDCTSKGAIHFISVNRGEMCFHLCKRCFDRMMAEMFRHRWSDDERQYVPSGDEAPKILEVSQKKWNGGWNGYCPHCGEPVEMYKNRFYCGTCGNEVKWE